MKQISVMPKEGGRRLLLRAVRAKPAAIQLTAEKPKVVMTLRKAMTLDG